MARVAVVGVGAIGGVCAANLIAGGHDVICCVRTPFRELTLESAGSVQTVPVRIETTPSSLPPVDWALLATKAHQTEGAIEWLTGAHRIAVLQNGVEHVERLARWIEPARLVPVVIACPASAGPPGHVVQRARAQMTVADTRDARDFAALFANTSIDAECTTDWPTAAWRKLCSNA